MVFQEVTIAVSSVVGKDDSDSTTLTPTEAQQSPLHNSSGDGSSSLCACNLLESAYKLFSNIPTFVHVFLFM